MHSTVINKQTLLQASPIKGMLTEKVIHEPSGMSYGLTEVGYDIRIAETIKFDPFKVTPVINSWQKRTDPFNHIPTTSYGRFTLASALEEFDMPADMVGYVKDKSSWARKGISVFNTSINPGQKGFITLELVFNGNEVVTIEAGTPIAQVHFMYLTHPAAYQGRYQNQEAGPQEAR